MLVIAAGIAVSAQGRGGGPAPAPLVLPADTPRITALKDEVVTEVDKLKEFSQQAVDQIFSYGELGFQEVETSHYLVELLKKNGFQVEQGVAGIPTAFMATWGNGDTELQPTRVLGSAWAQHFNRAVAQAAAANIDKVGMPEWSDADQSLARAVQKELGTREQGLATRVSPLQGPVGEAENTGGGSDDIGDVSWNVPTITLRYPSNIPGLPGHNWADGISMATPIAHKGVTAGAKVQAMTLIDLLLKPEVITAAWDYFKNVQTRTLKYEPLIRSQDQPAIDLNKATMEKYRPEMKKYYFDPTKYKTYLEQLGIQYPTIRK